MKKCGLVIIGGLPNSSPKSLGGATVLLKNFISYLEEKNYDYRLIVTNKYVGCKYGTLKNLLYFTSLFFCLLIPSKVFMFNLSARGIFNLFPFFAPLLFLFKKRVVLRIFGGGVADDYRNLSKLKKKLFDLSFKYTEQVYVETKELITFFNQNFPDNNKVYWFPNVRNMPSLKRINTFRGKFVFISQVRSTKGIDEILDISESLPKGYLIDIYGPIVDPSYTHEYFRKFNVSYKGVLKPSEILSTLYDYDVLLLPTYYPGEGYPGIIIEAYSLGKPVITTYWKAVPEIVLDNRTGFLIPPRCSASLLEAMLKFNETNYPGMSEQAMEAFSRNFCSEKTNKLVADRIYTLLS